MFSHFSDSTPQIVILLYTLILVSDLIYVFHKIPVSCFVSCFPCLIRFLIPVSQVLVTVTPKYLQFLILGLNLYLCHPRLYSILIGRLHICLYNLHHPHFQRKQPGHRQSATKKVFGRVSFFSRTFDPVVKKQWTLLRVLVKQLDLSPIFFTNF